MLPVNETAILKQITSYLALRGIFHWRANSGSRGKVSFNMTGCADIIGVRKLTLCEQRQCPRFTVGQFLAIEVKTATGKLSPAQESFRDQVETQGGLYILARSVADVEKALGRRGK